MINPQSADVVIIGGGIVGCSAALSLSRRGLRVILLERDTCGSRSSGVNFGGVRRQGRTIEQLPLAVRAKRIWDTLPDYIGIDGEYIQSGHLKLARSQQEFAELESYRERTRDFGLDLQLIGPMTLRQRFSWLASNVTGGSYCPQDGQANPRLVSPAFAAAARRAGTLIFERFTVSGIEKLSEEFHVSGADGSRFTAPNLLNCAGAWSKDLAAQFGDEVPLTQGYPAMAVTEPLPFFIPYSLGVCGSEVYCRQVQRGNVVMGGGRGIGLTDSTSRSTAEMLQTLMARIVRLIPSMRNVQIIRTWSGVEAYTPDKQPILCASPTTAGLFHGFGLSGAGFEIGPAVGEVLADLVIDGRTETPIHTFDLQRFTLS
ncbi:FAD-binding oxidoreductase [Serratia sp. M24T3]|uniref:NAD(P)/FAD-dependent oxidoreductase n=1 Tax=Serratia sp. M24T3 TaxID=932213 RepID=UPI00025B9130|nr:FAD-dependent oxidoreductase [Serratia sp. M24T3]EIC84316.1 FAD dependent oxidoreductase [Serratia sp. M24T3]